MEQIPNQEKVLDKSEFKAFFKNNIIPFSQDEDRSYQEIVTVIGKAEQYLDEAYKIYLDLVDEKNIPDGPAYAAMRVFNGNLQGNQYFNIDELLGK